MSIQKMTGVAVFAALVAVFSQMSLLIGPVPHTMQIFAVTLAGVVLGPKRGALSIVVWELLGAFGLPVFAMAHGGLTSLFGPLVGFFIGFIIHAYVYRLFYVISYPLQLYIFSALRAFGQSIISFWVKLFPSARLLQPVRLPSSSLTLLNWF